MLRGVDPEANAVAGLARPQLEGAIAVIVQKERVKGSEEEDSLPAQDSEAAREGPNLGMQRGMDSESDDAMNSGPPPRKEAVVENTTDSSIGSSAALDAIQREARERLATKADDAEVPTYLWEEHLIDDSEGRF
eukprot:scaffold58660_cov26-Attheya_sp.AAC.1